LIIRLGKPAREVLAGKTLKNIGEDKHGGGKAYERRAKSEVEGVGPRA